jgi:GH15 family glucan-1,4-alpha-glucosidase
MQQRDVNISDLAVLGDRRTCAYVSKSGSVVWYCPDRFDRPSLFAKILDSEVGGEWLIDTNDLSFESRQYLEDSTVLQTSFKNEDTSKELTLEDWMPMGCEFSGICRVLSHAPTTIRVKLIPKPDYGRQKVQLQKLNSKVSINQKQFFHSSHELSIVDNHITCTINKGDTAWFVLSDTEKNITLKDVQSARKSTMEKWKEVTEHITYHGPYEQEIRSSLRVLRLMTYAENGGVIAAGTTSLPEVKGGERNYDYRYVWLRDAAMIVSALTRAGSDGIEERKFLSFICSAMHEIDDPVVPFFTLDCKPAPGEELFYSLSGYANSQPIRIGNDANNQLQLDAISNVLLAAKLIYNNFDTTEHWDTVSKMADYLTEHWHEKDHGLWEETQKQHYTSSKVVASVSLKYIAEHSKDEEQKERWLKASNAIKDFVERECKTSEGAYAAYAGSEAVDVSAILFPIWAYTAEDTPAVLKTIEVLERNYCQNNLFRRHLVDFNSKKEGAFLAGTFWVAQYWVMRKDWNKFKQVFEAALAFMNDVGLMPEEGCPENGEFLGNIPQTFVHASLIGAAIDYKQALKEAE